MPIATYKLWIDWENDGTFSGSADDVSDDVMYCDVNRGFSTPLARMAYTGRLTALLRNDSKQYSPPVTGYILPKRAVKLTMGVGATSGMLYYGYLDEINPAPGLHGHRTVTLECSDALSNLDESEASIALLTNVRSDAVVEALIDEVYTPPSENYDAGINFFPVAGDKWHAGTNPVLVGPPMGGWNILMTDLEKVSQRIMGCCVSDWGRFFVAKNGAVTFRNRHYQTLNTSTCLVMNDDMIDMDYRFGVNEIYNTVEITCHPRSIGVVNEVLGQLDQGSAPIVETSASQAFVIRFRDPSQQARSIAGQNVITPVAGFDYICTKDPAGAGGDVSASVSIAASIYADRARIKLTNSTGSPTWVQQVKVRGNAIRTREPVIVSHDSASSINAYGLRKLQFDAPLMGRADEAALLAQYIVRSYETPLHDVEGVSFLANSATSLLEKARDLELLDRVVIAESQTGVSASGVVYRMKHTIKRGGASHRVTISVEETPLATGCPFLIGGAGVGSQLDSGHELIY